MFDSIDSIEAYIIGVFSGMLLLVLISRWLRSTW